MQFLKWVGPALLLVQALVWVTYASAADGFDTDHSLSALDDSEKKGALKLILKNVRGFCEQSEKADLFSQIFDDSGRVFSNLQSLDQALKRENSINANLTGAYPLSIYPNAQAKLLSYQYKLTNPMGSSGLFFGEADMRSYFKNLNKTRFFDQGESAKELDLHLHSEVYQAGNGEEKNLDIPFGGMPNEWVMGTLCAKADLKYWGWHTKGCVEVLKKIQSEMMPKLSNMALPAIEAVLDNEMPKFRISISELALKWMDRVKNRNADGDLFTDIQSTLIRNGFSEQDAEALTWNLIATYSTRGPNMFMLSQYSRHSNEHTLVALDIMSSAIAYLDQIATDSFKKPYSFPSEVKTACSYGEPYRFWMAAFLTRKYGIELNDPFAAREAVYLAEIGYQMLNQTMGNNPVEVFTRSAFSDANNKARLDLAFSGAGATYGMRLAQSYLKKSQSSRVISIDLGIYQLALNAEPLAPLTEDESRKRFFESYGIHAFLRWDSIFSPQSVFDAFD